jgi:hypothetical protein
MFTKLLRHFSETIGKGKVMHKNSSFVSREEREVKSGLQHFGGAVSLVRQCEVTVPDGLAEVVNLGKKLCVIPETWEKLKPEKFVESVNGYKTDTWKEASSILGRIRGDLGYAAALLFSSLSELCGRGESHEPKGVSYSWVDLRLCGSDVQSLHALRERALDEDREDFAEFVSDWIEYVEGKHPSRLRLAVELRDKGFRAEARRFIKAVKTLHSLRGRIDEARSRWNKMSSIEVKISAPPTLELSEKYLSGVQAVWK